MCLIVLAWRAQPSHPLVVAANRDEFHARPAVPAAFWRDAPSILAGRDLKAGGTWMGVSRNGRFGAVTNYRGGTEPSAAHSRGSLVTGFLHEGISPGKYIQKLRPADYSGFNLLLADREELWWFSNRDGTPRRLDAGLYGLGNLLLDDPEVEPAKGRLRGVLDAGPAVEPLFEVLGPARIIDPRYGTRCSTVMLAGRDGLVRYQERTFLADGNESDTAAYEFRKT